MQTYHINNKDFERENSIESFGHVTITSWGQNLIGKIASKLFGPAFIKWIFRYLSKIIRKQTFAL